MRTIRPITPRDAPAVAALYRQCRREADWLSPARAASADFERDTEGETVLAEFAIAGDGSQRPVGFISVCDESAFIHHLYVRADCHHQGTGRRLLAALVGRLPLPWQLKCLLVNVHARQFYDRGGWVQLAVEEDDGGTGDGAHALMELRSAPAKAPEFRRG